MKERNLVFTYLVIKIHIFLKYLVQIFIQMQKSFFEKN